MEILADFGDTLRALSASPAALELLATIVAVVWALPVLKKFREAIAKSKMDKVFELAKIAATATYQEYVQEIKRASADGKVTNDEIRSARAMSLTNLKKLLKAQAPGLLKQYGDAFLTYMIERAVNALKAEGKGNVGSN